MATAFSPVSDMLVTVKSRELQRGMLAEIRRDRTDATRHFLAAAHLELVLANDYTQAGQPDLARRSRLSAASCFWRAGQCKQAREMFATCIQKDPAQEPSIQQVIAELEHDYLLQGVHEGREATESESE
jgi:hypothetical protein